MIPTDADSRDATGQVSPILPPAVRQAVEAELSARITGADNFWPTRVFRCTLTPSSGSVPDTVIVRLPRDAEWAGLNQERTALEALAAAGSALAPRFLAGGADSGFLVSEDLGDGPCLLDLLLGEDPEAAKDGMFAFGRSLGRLHAHTAPAGLLLTPVPVAEHWEMVCDAVGRLGLPEPSRGVTEDVEEIGRILSNPGALLALSSGDPSVVNCKAFGNGIRFFDFERACVRHAFSDAVVLRFPYPTGGPPWRLPPEVAARAEAAYRTELAQARPAAASDAVYEPGMAAACAAWMIVRLARLPRVDAGPDRDSWPLVPPDWSRPLPTRSRRRQLVSIVETWTGSPGLFGSLAAWGVQLTDALRDRWPEAAQELPLYPAFET